jgi:hypothetical protein
LSDVTVVDGDRRFHDGFLGAGEDLEASYPRFLADGARACELIIVGSCTDADLSSLS